jgi:hypothetical protein
MKQIVRILRLRYQRKLRPVDVMDIMNIIGQIVVAGNVRRSSEIAIGDPHDINFLNAKNWGRHQIPNWRTMSNNSIAADRYDQILPQFWDSGYIPNLEGEMEGEPYGLVNLRNCRHYGRLIDGSDPNNDPDVVGVNPCVTADTWVQTSIGPRQVIDLISTDFKVIVNNLQHSVISDGFVKTGTKHVVNVKTQRGTRDHQILTKHGWKEAGQLTDSDYVVLDNSSSEWYGDLSHDAGWLVGNWLGDGTSSGNRAVLKWWDNIDTYRWHAKKLLFNTVGGRSDMGSGDSKVITSVGLMQLIDMLGVSNKHVNINIEQQGSDFYCGFLQGWFDADGTVSGDLHKGLSIRLSSSKIDNLLACQRMLARLGIISTIYENRHSAGMQTMPGGEYYCNARHDLVISRGMIDLFKEQIGFVDTLKSEKLERLLDNRKRKAYKTRFISKVTEVLDVGLEDVYDITVPGIQRFNANGIIVHNCAEITLANFEGCNLGEVFLPNVRSVQEFKDTAGILFKACKTISNAKFSYPATHEIVQKNHRIGIGLTGYMQAPQYRKPAVLDEVYKHLEDVDRQYSRLLDIKMSIKRTTVKPSGTLSLLPGVTPGMHGALGRHMLRTVRFSANHPLVQICRDHGYKVEPKIELDGSHNHDTMVVYFPIKTPPKAELASNMDVIDELEVQKELQTFWADNSVSATHYFEPADVPRIKDWLSKNYNDSVKTTSFLLREGHGFKQAPYQPIEEEQYYEEVEKVQPITHALIVDGWDDYDDVLECDGGHCPVK